MSGTNTLVTPTTETITIDIQAYVDGRDLLVIQGSTLQWEHLDFAAVGMWSDLNEPTIITTTLNGATQLDHVNWYPIWPEPLNTGQWGTGDSSVFLDLAPTLPTTDMTVSLDTISARNSLTIYQLPTASNNETLILDFNDDPSSAAT